MEIALWINSTDKDTILLEASLLDKLYSVQKPVVVFSAMPELFKDNEMVSESFSLSDRVEGYTLFTNDGSGNLKLYQVEGKVRLVHLLLEDDLDPNRQTKSIDSLSKLADYGVEYIQVWNKRWTEEPPRENFTRPKLFDSVIKPGHYGAFRAFADASLEYFTEDVDHFIMCEGDAILTVHPREAIDRINQGVKAIKDHDISYFSFGNRYTLEDNLLQSKTVSKFDDVYLVDRIIGIQMIMFPQRIRAYLNDRFVHHTWDGADIFLNNIFVKKFNMGMLEESITSQVSGMSAIEQTHRSFGDKKKLVFLAPHLSTGGMPEFLLKRIQALQDQDEFEIHVIEYCLYAMNFTVQRNQIIDLLGDNFHEIAYLNSIEPEERGNRLIELVESISPDVIHIEECPEAFDAFNQISYEAQTSLYASHRPWKIVETCHNIWFNPEKGKRISPDAYAFVTPHHELETFAKENSIKQQVLFPIVEQSVSDIARRKMLEVFGFQPEAQQYHLINIGLWTPGKNQGEAIEWARALEAESPGRYQFHFIGNQASNFEHYWAPLMEDLPANCHVHGERSDVDSFYQIADAVVFNSTWECNPLTVRQSLGYPIPVIARNLPQYHDMYTGQLVEITGNLEEDLSALKQALESPKQTRTNEYTMAKFKKEHLNLYKDMLETNTSRPHSSNFATITWENGPKVTSHVGHDIHVEFWADGELIYDITLGGIGHWAKPSIEYFVDWKVIIDGIEYTLPMLNSTQMVQFDSSSLGDTLSWVEPCVKFKEKHKLGKLYIATYKNWLFDHKYYESMGIYFTQPDVWPKDCQAVWKTGVYMEDVGGQAWFPNKNKRDWRKIYLGDIASDTLGVEQVMRAPKLVYRGRTKQKRPYICIATASTAQAKYWNNPTGWQELVDHYKSKGYDVYHISKEETNIRGVKKSPEDLKDVYRLLEGAELFFGISSGLSWFAWATDVPVVLISGFTPEICEFDDEKTLRIINKDVCNSCWFREHFDRGDWNWCPEHKDTERMFECTKQITSKEVIEKAESHLANLNKV